MIKLFKIALIALIMAFSFNAKAQTVYSKAQLDWVLEKSVNQYGVSAYLDPNLVVASRQVVILSDTWTDVTLTVVEAHISGFTNGTGTDFVSALDLTGKEVIIDTRVNGYCSTPDTEIEANMYINSIACNCGGGVRLFKTIGDAGFFSFIAESKNVKVGDIIHMKIKASKNTVFTFERLPIVISIR